MFRKKTTVFYKNNSNLMSINKQNRFCFYVLLFLVSFLCLCSVFLFCVFFCYSWILRSDFLFLFLLLDFSFLIFVICDLRFVLCILCFDMVFWIWFFVFDFKIVFWLWFLYF